MVRDTPKLESELTYHLRVCRRKDAYRVTCDR